MRALDLMGLLLDPWGQITSPFISCRGDAALLTSKIKDNFVPVSLDRLSSLAAQMLLVDHLCGYINKLNGGGAHIKKLQNTTFKKTALTSLCWIFFFVPRDISVDTPAVCCITTKCVVHPGTPPHSSRPPFSPPSPFLSVHPSSRPDPISVAGCLPPPPLSFFIRRTRASWM